VQPTRAGGIAVVAAFAMVLGGCFAPVAVPGSPCAEGGVCPSGLRCVAGICTDAEVPLGPCDGLPDGTPCGDPASSDCDGADTCVGGACVTNQAADGATCDDCASGAATCASCAMGACPDAACTPGGGVPVGGELVAPVLGGNGNEGNMFDVVASGPLTITSFETNTATAGMTEYEIWHKPGTHVGSETDRAAWTRIGTATFMTLGPEVYTPIPIPIGVTLAAGERHAFYLTHKTLNNRYHNGTAVGTLLASTPELAIYEGVANDYATSGFGAINTPRAWEGKIHYRHGGGTTLATSVAGAATSDGVMFDVDAKADVQASLLAVHLAAGTHDVEVYFRRGGRAGVETMPAAWTRLAALTGVTSAGDGTPTILPFAFELFLETASTTGFYVAVAAPAQVRTAPSTGMAAATNAELTIGEGVAVTGAFGAVGAAVTPSLELGYGVCD